MAASIAHAHSSDVKHCEQCGEPYRKSPKGDGYHFRKRRFCSPRCAALSGVKDRPLAERLGERTDKSGDCWIWTGALTKAGYGIFSFRNKLTYAHRAAYEISHGPIRKGIVVCHRCDTPACCNPAHLFLGTQADNLQDMYSKGRNGQTGLKGVNHHQAKLTEAEVLAIRASEECGSVLADRLGVSKTTIYDIRSRKIWRHI